jgi:hypothetical protein
MATFETEQDVIRKGMTLRPGQIFPGVMDLTKVVREEGKLAESVLSFLAQTQVNPTLSDFALGIQGILGLYGGPNTERNIGRVIAAIRYAPVIVTRATAAMKSLAGHDPEQPGFMGLINTDFGPVVHMNICQAKGDSLSFFLNPKGSAGDGFLTSIFSFPMVTWVMVENGNSISIGAQLANGGWPQQILNLQREARKIVVPEDKRDFGKAVQAAEMKINE